MLHVPVPSMKRQYAIWLSVGFLLGFNEVVGDSSSSRSFSDSVDLGTPWLYPGLAVFCFGFAFVDAYGIFAGMLAQSVVGDIFWLNMVTCVGIGANDVANSFSTAVASGTITHETAIKIGRSPLPSSL